MAPGSEAADATGVAVTSPTRRARPAILTVDDDPQVLATVARDLRRRYGDRFRVVRADDGETALASAEQLLLAGEPLALVVSDQRMPGMSGTDLLRRVRELHPAARTVLLTAYADTDAAITAINEIHLDHYVLKPWDPPEERLYPVLDELLGDWEAGRHATSGGVRLVGSRWSTEAHRIRDLLTRNLVPFEWLDVEAHAEAAARLRAAAGEEGLPLLVLPDGRHEVAPSNRRLADLVGLRASTTTTVFDLLVVGGGPAGLAAAVYGASEGLRTAVLEREGPGGQAGLTSRIDDYLGFPSGVAGGDLARRALDQARRFGAEILSPVGVGSLSPVDGYRVVALDDGTTLAAKAVIVATGVVYRTLDVQGVERFVDAGVSHGASVHDVRASAGEDVVVVGDGDPAGAAALQLARVARQVTMVVGARSLEAGMGGHLAGLVRAAPAICVLLEARLDRLQGGEHLEGVEVVDAAGERRAIPTSRCFVCIGADPRTGWLDGALARDDHGFVLTGSDLSPGRTWPEARAPFTLEASLPGVFAAGDVRARSVKRVASAVAEGSIAVHMVHEYLEA